MIKDLPSPIKDNMQYKKSNQRNMESENFSHFILLIILPASFGVIVIVIAMLYFKRRIKLRATHGGGEHGVLISVCCESNQGNFNRGISGSSDHTALVKEVHV